MEEEEKQVENTPQAPARDKRGRLLPGQCGNPNGHPKGQPNYKQRFRHLMEDLSKWKAPDAVIAQIKNALPGMPQDATIELVEAARVHLAALMGESWAFDRLHDRPGQSVDMTTNGKEINNTTVNVIDVKTSDLANRIISGETKQNDPEHDQNISG